ncbi:MAG TPA: SRPBCC domain-containing protein [Terriglobales bacterium]
MATAAVTPDKDAIVAEIFIAAPRERVFQAITDPAQTSQWWGQKGLYRIVGGQADIRPGGKWVSKGVAEDGTPFQVDGEYLEVDPPRLLVHTWNPSYDNSLKTTVVRWELEPHSVHGLQQSGPQKMGTGTMVRIHHSGFAGNVKAASDHGEGWKRVMGWMRAFVEKGETMDTRKE